MGARALMLLKVSRNDRGGNATIFEGQVTRWGEGAGRCDTPVYLVHMLVICR